MVWRNVFFFGVLEGYFCKLGSELFFVLLWEYFCLLFICLLLVLVKWDFWFVVVVCVFVNILFENIRVSNIRIIVLYCCMGVKIIRFFGWI